MARLIGIDIGTSSCKALVIDERGNVLAQASRSYPVSMPHASWSEQDPRAWWTGAESCLAELDASTAAAIGLTGQMHGAVFLDAADEVIRPAILWNDQRTTEECADIDAEIGPDVVRKITCNPPLTGFQLPKLLWLRKHEPANYDRIRSVLLPKDYVRLKLTGDHATDPSDASGTGIFDVPQRQWSAKMAEALNIDPSLFPNTYESVACTGTTADGVSVAAGAGDQAAGAVGTGTVREGVVSVSIGTSGVVFTPLNEPNCDPQGALHTFCHANGRWHAMGVMLSCGGALEWYAREFHSGSVEAVLREAEQAKVGAGGLAFLPYLSGERSPHNDPYARGTWTGLTLSHGRAEMSRAVVEGIVFGLRDSLERVKGLGVNCTETRITGGGARSGFLVQVIADVFQTPCKIPAANEGPAFGAALLAGVSKGIWKDIHEACAAAVRFREEVLPSGADYSIAYSQYGRLYGHLKPWWEGARTY